MRTAQRDYADQVLWNVAFAVVAVCNAFDVVG
jgi:hypothetical protein